MDRSSSVSAVVDDKRASAMHSIITLQISRTRGDGIILTASSRVMAQMLDLLSARAGSPLSVLACPANSLISLVRPVGLEPTTFGSGDGRPARKSGVDSRSSPTRVALGAPRAVT